MDYAIQVKNLTKRYRDFSLENLNFNLEKGTINGFVGPNGAGKTTTIKCFLNLVKPDSGEVRILGMDSIKQDCQLKDRIGIVLDEGYFYENLTIKEMKNLLKPFYSFWDEDMYHEYLKKFDLPQGKKIKELSKGMRMKYSILLAMSHGAELLIMDEPTSGLDPLIRADIIDILKNIIQDENKTVFFSTHITSDLDKIADNLIFLNDGQIFLMGEKDEIKSSHVIVRGPCEYLTDNIRRAFIFLNETSYGFDGLTTQKELMQKTFSDKARFEIPSVEDLLLYYTRRKLA